MVILIYKNSPIAPDAGHDVAERTARVVAAALNERQRIITLRYSKKDRMIIDHMTDGRPNSKLTEHYFNTF